MPVDFCRHSMQNLYKTLVRPHLEYCLSARSLHYQKDKKFLRKVQHRFTRMIRLPVLSHYNMKTGYRNWDCGLYKKTSKSCWFNRVFLKWFMVFFAIPLTDMFQIDTSRRARGHSLKLVKCQCSKDITKFFFCHRLVSKWKILWQQKQ